MGADPNAKDNAWGETALMRRAAALNRASVVKVLIAHGAGVNVTSAKVVRLDKRTHWPR